MRLSLIALWVFFSGKPANRLPLITMEKVFFDWGVDEKSKEN